MRNQRNYLIKLHVISWMVYALLFYAINKLGNQDLSFWTVLVSLPFFAFVFYGVRTILKRWIGTGKILAGICLLGGFLVICGLLVYLMTYGWQQKGIVYGKYVVQGKDFDLREFIQTCLIMLGHFTFLAILDFLNSKRMNEIAEKIEQMEMRFREETLRKDYEYHGQAEQIPSHFLLNVFQMWESQLGTANSQIGSQLTQMYQLVEYFMGSGSVDGGREILLSKEIEMARKYLSLQMLISSRKPQMEWKVSGNTKGVVIPPATLLGLVMNIFKHGSAYDPLHPAVIEVDVQRDSYRILARNKCNPSGHGLISHGLGLVHMRNRLDTLFKDRCQLKIERDQDIFLVDILVRLI